MKKIIIATIAVLLSCTLLFTTGCEKKKKEEEVILPKYTIIFESNGGTKVAYQIVEEGKQIIEPEKPTKKGYTFDGWYLNLSDEEAYDFKKEVKGDITLHAKWSNGQGEEEKEETKEVEEPEAKTEDKKEDKKENSSSSSSSSNSSSSSSNSSSSSSGSSSSSSSGNSGSNSGSGSQTPTTVSVTGVSLTSSVTLNHGGNTSSLVATVEPANATNKGVTYTSSNEGVATVSASGVVTSHSPGTAVITVTTADGSKTATCTVTVKDTYTYSWVDVGDTMGRKQFYIISNGTGAKVSGTVSYVYNDEPSDIKTKSVTSSGLLLPVDGITIKSYSGN